MIECKILWMLLVYLIIAIAPLGSQSIPVTLSTEADGAAVMECEECEEMSRRFHGRKCTGLKITCSIMLVLAVLMSMLSCSISDNENESGDSTLLFGVMVHLEGWNDGVNEAQFRRHAELLREYATLFEEYGAKLTLESKEMTEGCIRWGDNVLLEMEQRGHGIGVHADIGGNRNETLAGMELKLSDMKARLESLGVTVRHASGIVSHCDWVTAAAETGYEFVTGTVAYGLLSLPAEERPIEIPDNATPAMFHQPYPFALGGRITPWRAESGLNWIYDSPNGRIVIIPSGGGIHLTFEESQSSPTQAGKEEFTAEDIDAFESELNEILTYVKSDKVYTYYVSWSFGQALDKSLLEEWLRMVNEYVEQGKVQWGTMPEMYDAYVNWESKNRNQPTE